MRLGLLSAFLAAFISSAANAAPVETTLYEFTDGPDGGNPTGPLIADAGGNLYVTVTNGGGCTQGDIYGCGAVVEFVHSKAADSWSTKVLYDFQGGTKDGMNPTSAVISDSAGNLYTTTRFGGADPDGNCRQGSLLSAYYNAYGCGTVIKLIPPAKGQTTWTEKVIYSFKGGTADGANPNGSLIIDQAGNLYTTTISGGAYSNSNISCSGGCGTAVELSPPATGKTTWTEHVLYNFGATATDGTSPFAGLIADKSGNLYTTTFGGGDYVGGTIIELTPPPSDQTAWTENILYSFNPNGKEGYNPEAALVADASGNLYTTTYEGGNPYPKSYGAILELSPPIAGQTVWTETTLYDFVTPASQGSSPLGSLIIDAAGNLYTTVFGGGAYSSGGIIKLAAPAAGKTKWRESLLYSFTGNSDGASPVSGPYANSNGDLFVAANSGADGINNTCYYGCGAIVELSKTGFKAPAPQNIYQR